MEEFIEQKALIINASDESSEVKTLQDPKILGPMDYGLYYGGKEDYLIFGKGLLAGSPIPGTHRLIVAGYSQQWEHFYDSTMGGAAYVFLRLGVNYLHIKGRKETPHVLILNRKEGKLEHRFEPVDIDAVWEGEDKDAKTRFLESPDEHDKIGFYAMQEYIFNKYKDEFKACRVIATGPSAKQSASGALGSAPVERGELTPVDCWAGRGGMGSQLLQRHGIVGIIYGGDEMIRDPRLTDRQKIDNIFMEKFNMKMINEDLFATKKYRYDDKFHTGGTFGVNFAKIKGEIFCFNYRSVNWTEEQREAIHKKFILGHYLEQFNNETVEPRAFKHCGEPCPAVCKKMRGVYKKDYEPYQTLGPNAGIFDQRAAELANHYADAMGIDAIQAGIFVSWIMDCIDRGYIKKEYLGLTIDPKFDPEHFDVEKDSMNNAKLAIEIMDLILKDERFKDGMRVAAKKLSEEFNHPEIQHLAVYNAHGEKGCMVANQYWTPGMYSPMPLMGKYCTSYGVGYIPPKEIGKKNVERMVYELYSDNGGLCRFHRKWIEEAYPELVNKLYGVNFDFHKHHAQLAVDINKENKAVFWETERLIQLIHGFLKRWSAIVYEDENAKSWVKRFDEDEWKAAKEYWQEIYDGQNEMFAQLEEEINETNK